MVLVAGMALITLMSSSCGRRVLLVVVGVLGTGRWGDRERCMCRVDLELLGNAGLGS